MIEVVLDELEDYFRDEGFKVNFEIIDDLSVYVHFENNGVYDVDAFYKKKAIKIAIAAVMNTGFGINSVKYIQTIVYSLEFIIGRVPHNSLVFFLPIQSQIISQNHFCARGITKKIQNPGVNFIAL